MTMRCPTCGRTFPASKKFCDQDASALVAAGQRRKGSLLLPVSILLMLAVIGGGVVWGPGLARAYLKAHLSVAFGTVEVKQGLSFWPDLDLVLRARNTTGFSVALHSARLTCSLAGASLITIEGPPAGSGPLTIPSGSGDTEVRLRVKPNLIGLDGLKGFPTSWDASCDGPVEVSLWGIKTSRNVAVKAGLQQ